MVGLERDWESWTVVSWEVEKRGVELQREGVGKVPQGNVVSSLGRPVWMMLMDKFCDIWLRDV